MKWNSSFKSRHPHKDLESSVDIKSIFLSFWNAADCPFCQVCQFSNLYFGKSLCHQVFGLCQSQPQPRRNNSQCNQNFYEAVAIKFLYIGIQFYWGSPGRKEEPMVLHNHHQQSLFKVQSEQYGCMFCSSQLPSWKRCRGYSSLFTFLGL